MGVIRVGDAGLLFSQASHAIMEKMKGFLPTISSGTVLALLGMVLLVSCKESGSRPVSVPESEEEQQHVYYYGICADTLDLNEYRIKKGETPAAIFANCGFSPAYSYRISQASAEVLDPRRIQAGFPYYTLNLRDSASTVCAIIFAKSKLDFAVIDLRNDTIVAYEYEKPVVYKRHYTEGVIKSSLWETMVSSGANPVLAMDLANLYAWQIDFFDVQPGDAYRVLYDVAYIDDTVELGINDIQSAIFIHQKDWYPAIPFVQDSVRMFFDTSGNSLRKAFLKAPLDYYRISSKFSNSRFHPVLKRYRPHHGVDYAAPTGTPVKSIGDGKVIAKKYDRGGGNMVKIRHNATYTTSYMHLSRYGKGIAVGTRVRQGQVIGYVGSTGLSTGPHLDFRVYKNGRAINPLTMEAPPDVPVKAELRAAYDSVRRVVMAQMDSLHAAWQRSHPAPASE